MISPRLRGNFPAKINRVNVSVIRQCVRSAHSLTVITLLQRMFHFQKDAANRPQPPYSAHQSVRSIYCAGPTRFLPLLKRAFAGGLLRLERSRLTLGVRDGALAAGKPDEASGEDEGEKHHGRCEAEADPLDEVGVGSREDRLLRGGIEMLDRPAGPDLAGVSAGVRVPDNRRGDFLALGRIRKRVGEVGAEGCRQCCREDRAEHGEPDGGTKRALCAHDARCHSRALGRDRRHRERGDRRQAQPGSHADEDEADTDDDRAPLQPRDQYGEPDDLRREAEENQPPRADHSHEFPHFQRHDHQAHAVRQEEQPGIRRRETAHVLHVLRDHEQHPVYGEHRGEDRDDRERIRAVAEELQVHHRVRAPAFADDECRQRRPRDHEQREDLPREPTRPRAFDHGKRESPDCRHEQELPGDVERARALVPRLHHEAPRQGQDDEPDGNIDHEDRAPAGPLHHEAAERRPDRDGRARDRGPDADRPALQLRIGKRGADERERGHVDRRRRDPLDRAREVERFERGRHAAGSRGRREENDPRKVELPPAVDVRHRPGRHDGDRHPEAVRRDHPLQARLAHLEVRLDGGQRDVHDQRVQIDHEEAETRGREGEALCLGHGASIASWRSSYFDSSICFTRLTTAGSISYNPFTIFSMPGPSIGSISSFAFSASARS